MLKRIRVPENRYEADIKSCKRKRIKNFGRKFAAVVIHFLSLPDYFHYFNHMIINDLYISIIIFKKNIPQKFVYDE